MQNPLLSGASVAAGKYQWRSRYRTIAAANVDALAADSHNRAVGHRPILTRAAAAGNVDDGRSVGARASLYVDAKSGNTGNLPIVHGPLLVPPRVTRLHL